MAKDWQRTRLLPQGRWVAIAVIAIAVSGVLPFARVHLTQAPAFLPVIVTLVTLSFALAAFLLFQGVLYGRDGRLAAAGSAYVFAALAAVPAVVANNNTAPWFWTVWHCGYAVLIVVAFSFNDLLSNAAVTQSARRKLVLAGISVPAGVGVLAIASVILLGSGGTESAVRLHQSSTQFVVVLVLTLAALYKSFGATRGTHAVERWIPVGVLASLGNVICLAAGHGRYSLGWYSGMVLSVISGAIVAGALLMNIAALYRNAEADKHVLEDEALHLLKETRAARYQADRVRRIIENAADAYVEIDGDGIIRAWNTKAADMFGWRSMDAIGHNFAGLVMSSAGRSQLDDFIGEFWLDPERFDGARAEIIAMNRNTVEFPVEVTMWVDESDFQPQMNFFLRDITIRRQADEQLQRALEDERQAVQRLQDLDRAKTDFVSSVSHELRSPLTSTLGFLELLAEGDAGDLTGDQLRMIDIASRNARRLFIMIEDLLTLSRIEENAFRVSYKPVRMESLVNTIVEHNKMLAAENSVHLDLDMRGPLGVCPGDEQQLARAIDNIIGNAVKFTPSGGEVKVAVRRERDEIVVTVSDTGIGIPQEEQPHLFNRFFRASVAIENAHGGTGLGLTIAKAIIDHHNGSIMVDSKLGRGTTVTVRCPALPVDETIDLAAF